MTRPSPSSDLSLALLAAYSARELAPRIGSFSAEMMNTRALGQRLVAAGSAASPDAATQQVLGVIAASTRNADETQAKRFAVQIGESLVQVAEEGWNTARDRSELKRFSLDFSHAASPPSTPAQRQTAASTCRI